VSLLPNALGRRIGVMPRSFGGPAVWHKISEMLRALGP
jgi:hypothetical protein